MATAISGELVSASSLEMGYDGAIREMTNKAETETAEAARLFAEAASLQALAEAAAAAEHDSATVGELYAAAEAFAAAAAKCQEAAAAAAHAADVCSANKERMVSRLAGVREHAGALDAKASLSAYLE